MKPLSPPLKWHGGKQYLAPKFWDICEPILPTIEHCVETHCGGAAWTLEGLARGYKKSFVINDLNLQLTNFWRVLQNAEWFGRFYRIMQNVPFSQSEYGRCPDLPWVEGRGIEQAAINCACRFFVCCRQSLAGRMDSFAPLSRTRTRRGMNEQASAWMTCVDGLPEVHAALRQVVILNDEAVKVIEQQDGDKTLFMVDPPYLHETRSTTGEYEHEMTYQQHRDLLVELKDVEGKFILCGYPSGLYDEFEHGCMWNRHTFDLPNNAASGKTKQRKQETLWCNF